MRAPMSRIRPRFRAIVVLKKYAMKKAGATDLPRNLRQKLMRFLLVAVIGNRTGGRWNDDCLGGDDEQC